MLMLALSGRLLLAKKRLDGFKGISKEFQKAG
jgi:hypothetical protein